jgi:uncharacterized protein (TIGR02145 family)
MNTQQFNFYIHNHNGDNTMETHTLCKYIRNRFNPLIGVIGVLTILTSCGQHSFDEWLFGTSSSSEEEEDSSSSVAVSSSSRVSSSSVGSSSSVANMDKGTFLDSLGNKTYKWVKIGDQVWMAENLDLYISGGKCYDNYPPNCDKYGRLYNWATAMALDTSCNSTSCSGQVGEKHRGICPSGWHIPSDAEWDALISFIHTAQGLSAFTSGASFYAGKYLKATSGWNSGGNGEDTYGFYALPGGYRNSAGDFYLVGEDGSWWSSSEDNKDRAYGRNMVYNYDRAYRLTSDKVLLQSVRCVSDMSTMPSSSSSVVSSSSSSSSVVASGSCDIKDYKTVTIGEQTWMAENFNCEVDGSKCYDNDPANCTKYGRLYDWATAMGLASTYNSTLYSAIGKHRGICPGGWHLPSNAEWDKLYRFADGTLNGSSYYSSPTAGGYLKATSGWNDYSSSSGNGTDAYGFSALPGGYKNSAGDFSKVGDYGLWWSSWESSRDVVHSRLMLYSSEVAYCDGRNKSLLLSVRCVRD